MPRTPDDSTTLTAVHRGLVRLPSLVLTATDREGRETSCPLGMTPVVVGTDVDATLRVNDAAVSRRHCLVTLTSQGVLVRDLRSKNGTSVGGIEIVEGFLTSTTFARIGGVTLRVRSTGAPRDVPLWPEARFGGALGGSTPMRALFRVLHDAAQTTEPILIQGESGTGKTLLAEAVHGVSPRKEGPLTRIDGATARADTWAPAILEETAGGTLILDEVSDLPPELQAKALACLDTPHVRVVATTQRDLRKMAADGAFRGDLLYRLVAVEARVPPLRERTEDIELLVERFLAAEVPPRTVLDLPAGALGMLNAHDWPGNVRELKTALTRLSLFPYAAPLPVSALLKNDDYFVLPWREARERVMEEFEARYVAAKLEENAGNVSRAADVMGISRQLLHRLLIRYGLRGRS